MTQSGIADNIFSVDNTNICTGQTIFGLTSTTGISYINNISFVADVNSAITSIVLPKREVSSDIYYNPGYES